jgi:site-specific DNA-methyltransferase (adenine-specific)
MISSDPQVGYQKKEFSIIRVGDSVVTLHNEDCFKYFPYIPQVSIDCIVTSPPYNIGTKYGLYDDKSERKEYLYWIQDWLSSIYPLMSDGGSLFLNVGGVPSNPWLPFQILNHIGNYRLQNVIHWIKSISIGDESHGHYKPINSRRYLNDCHEYIFHLTKEGDVPLDRLAIGVPYQDKSNVKRWSGKEDIRCRGNTWYLPYQTIQSRKDERPHPSSFPLELPKRCLKLHGVDKIKTVMDPFMGIGTTAVAAIELGLDFVGCEVEKEYYEISKKKVLGRIPSEGNGILP